MLGIISHSQPLSYRHQPSFKNSWRANPFRFGCGGTLRFLAFSIWTKYIEKYLGIPVQKNLYSVWQQPCLVGCGLEESVKGISISEKDGQSQFQVIHVNRHFHQPD